jgi:Sugar (and other) transporter
LATTPVSSPARSFLSNANLASRLQPRKSLSVAFCWERPSGQLAWIAVICLMGYVASFAISLGPIFWLLIAEIYPLKIRGYVQLGLEPDRLAYVSDIGRETRCEFNVFALRDCLDNLLALRLLLCARNERAHFGTDRRILESKASCSPNGQLKFPRCRYRKLRLKAQITAAFLPASPLL